MGRDIMGSYEIIDMYIDKLVLYFNNNQETSNIIKKLSNMYGKNVIATKHGLEYKGPYINTKIDVDEQKGTIDIYETGKKYGFDNQYFINNVNYAIKNGTGSVIKSSVDYETEELENGFIITNENIVIFSKSYQDNKCTISTTSNIKRKKDHITGNKKENIFQKTEYILASGDIIQIINKDGNKNYYCLSKNDTLNSVDGYNKIKITEEEYNRILGYENDVYQILNDKVISRIRKMF